MAAMILLNLLRLSPFFSFALLLVCFLPWPLISIALLVQFFSVYFFPRLCSDLEPDEPYLPRLPTEVYATIASFIDNRQDLVRFTFASRSMYNVGNAFLYRQIVMDEHPSKHVPWFRRRLFRLQDSLTAENALYVRHADFSFYHDINEEYLLAILQKCKRLTSLSLPAMEKPIDNRFITRQSLAITEPCFLSARLSVPIYDTVTSLTWIGSFIPLRGQRRIETNGRETWSLFPSLRFLTIQFRPDTKYVPEHADTWYEGSGKTEKDVGDLMENLKYLASSCPYLEEIILPFWEPLFSRVSRSTYQSFNRLQRIEFLTVDTKSKLSSCGTGLLKFIFEMHEIGVDVSFANPYQLPFVVGSLIDEIDLRGRSGDHIRLLSQKVEFEFCPALIHPTDWHDLNLLEWIHPSTPYENAQMTLWWYITPRTDPRFFIPPVFTGVLFCFDGDVRRYDASSFLKLQRYISEVVEMPHVRRVRLNMDHVNAFYLAFPLFMQFYGSRALTLCVERLLLPQRKGWETLWLRRQWNLQRQRDGDEEVVALEDLGKDGIHVHPARLFERVMLGLMFCGERNIQEITCVFRDRYMKIDRG